ncbi:flagellar hook-basal body complex protein [Bacillus timonensis]|nr:flagellar hook-basal body complex protein [Bacillus timonensis]
MYSGISGMKNFQIKLDVIGNNIANVNTYGFKKGRTTFKDLISQQLEGSNAATGSRGGINSKQVGLGATLASIDTIHTTGSTQTTSRLLDLALSGDGFFAVGSIKDISKINMDSPTTLGNNKILGAIDGAMEVNYTRAGNFYLDEKGYLVNAEGLYLIGEAGTKNIPTAAAVSKANDALTAIKSFQSPFKDMDDSLKSLLGKTDRLISSYQDYEEKYNIWLQAGQPASGPEKDDMDTVQNALSQLVADYDTFVTDPASGFNQKFSTFNNAIGNTSTANTLNKAISDYNTVKPITDIVKQITTSLNTLASGTDYPNNAVASGSPLSNEITVLNSLVNTLNGYKLDMNKIGQSVIGFEDSAEALTEPDWTEDLSGQGGLIQIPLTAKSFSISPDGKVSFVNEKGELKLAGQVKVANFANSGGLEKVGGNLFRATSNSGSLDRDNNGIQIDELFTPGSEGTGAILSGTLEMSNVDLSEEFTEMIVAQRGFQSNTKIITTSDEILQELVNLKR